MTLADNTYLASLINTGSDAMKNLYLVEFSGGIFTDEIVTALRVRNQDFTPPSFSQAKDTKEYLSVSLDVPGAGITGDKTFSLNIRLDSNYKVYAALLKQQSYTMSGNDGWVTNEVPDSNATNAGFTVTVKAYKKTEGYSADDEESYKPLYVFRHCWIKGLDPISYTYSSNSPLAIKANFAFMDYDDPKKLLFE